MYLTLPAAFRQSFLSHAARCARQPLHMSLNGDTLDIEYMPAKDIASALAEGPFVLWEARELAALAARKLACFTQQQREETLAAARTLIEEDVKRDTETSGPHRLERIAMRAEQILRESGRLDFLGFCRFALPGHLSYLRRVLDLAADEILAAEEYREYLHLLSELTVPGKSTLLLRLFFSEGAICHIWRQDENGIRPVEGGCIRGAEDMLLANIFAARPKKVAVSGVAYAPLSVLELLEQVFGPRLSYEDGMETLDNPPGQ